MGRVGGVVFVCHKPLGNDIVNFDYFDPPDEVVKPNGDEVLLVSWYMWNLRLSWKQGELTS